MKEKIDISAAFSFKGQCLEPSVTLDLAQLMEIEQSEAGLYPLLAQANGIGLYSYEYEMLLAEPLVFSADQGLAQDFIHAGRLDWDGLERAWKDQLLREQLTQIARQHMEIQALSDIEGLEATLFQAFSLGQAKQWGR